MPGPALGTGTEQWAWKSQALPFHSRAAHRQQRGRLLATVVSGGTQRRVTMRERLGRRRPRKDRRSFREEERLGDPTCKGPGVERAVLFKTRWVGVALGRHGGACHSRNVSPEKHRDRWEL